MQITCPHCTTSYEVADTAIGPQGRTVRCVRCHNVWRTKSEAALAVADHAKPDEAAFSAELGTTAPESPPLPPSAEPSPEPSGPVEVLPQTDSPTPEASVEAAEAMSPAEFEPVPEPIAEAAEEPAPMALSDIPIPVSDAPPLQPSAGHIGLHEGAANIENGSEDIESVAARRERAAASRRNRLRVPLPVAIAAMFVVCASLIGLRKDVVRHVPQLASLYASIGLPVNLRGLDFSDVKTASELHDGVPVLVVEGEIVSKVAMPVDVPRLRFALLNASGAELYAWTAQPMQAVLKPGEKLPFRSRLASPPAEGHDVQVRFFTRRDAVAGLR